MNEFDDPFSLEPHSRPSGRRESDGRESRLLGQPILAWNPATNNRSIPDEYCNHPLIAGQYFYTLPRDIIDAVVSAIGEESFDADLLRTERELSAVGGDHSMHVGFWQGKPIGFAGLLPTQHHPFREDLVRACGMEPVVVDHAVRALKERHAGPLERFRRGYSGWVMLNTAFLDEHDELLREHSACISRWGTDHTAYPNTQADASPDKPSASPLDDEQWKRFREASKAFCRRWRLLHLAAPCLPVPLQALMAGSFPLSIVEQMMGTGGVFSLPDIMPIPARDELRSMLDDSLHRGEQPEHLAEWLNIVRSSNTARNQMDRFGRLLAVQHFWKILHRRHGLAVKGNVGRLQEAFGSVFDKSQQSINADLIEIRCRLGSDWLDRACPLSAVAEVG